MDDWTGGVLDREPWPEAYDADPQNLGFPCHPGVLPWSDDTLPERSQPQYRLTCPACGSAFWARALTFVHPRTVRVVFEWASVTAGAVRVHPVPSRLLLGCASPLWADLGFRSAPEDPRPFAVAPDVAGGPTLDDVADRGHPAVLSECRDRATDCADWAKPDVRLLAVTRPVTVDGHLVARLGDVLLARPWWRVPGADLEAVIAYVPRLGRSVVLHDSISPVSVPLAVRS